MIFKFQIFYILGQTPAFMHVVAGGIKLNAAEGEEEKRDLEKIIGRLCVLILVYYIQVRWMIGILIIGILMDNKSRNLLQYTE